MQFTSTLLFAIQAAGVLSAPYAGNTGDAPDLANSSIPPPNTPWLSFSDKAVCEIEFSCFAPPRFNTPCLYSSSCHACIPTQSQVGKHCIRLAPKTHLNKQLLTPRSYRVPSPPAAVSRALPTAVISARNAAGRSAVMADSGAGLPAVTALEPGTDVPTGANATRTSRAARTVKMLESADAAARVFRGKKKGGKPWARCMR